MTGGRKAGIKRAHNSNIARGECLKGKIWQLKGDLATLLDTVATLLDTVAALLDTVTTLARKKLWSDKMVPCVSPR
jgi:hypothetical protein